MTDTVVGIKRSLSALTSQLQNDGSYDATLLDDMEIDLDRVLEDMSEEYAVPGSSWETGTQSLFEALCESESLIVAALNKIDLVQKENTEIRKKFEDLEAKLKHMEVKLKNMEANRFLLMLGQVAYDIDDKVTKKVLDGIVKPEEHISTIKDMEAAINGRDHFDVLQSKEAKDNAQRRWESLKKTIGWSNRLSRYLRKLKKNRVAIAHPLVNNEFIESALKNKAFNLPSPDIVDEPLLLELVKIHKMLCT